MSALTTGTMHCEGCQNGHSCVDAVWTESSNGQTLACPPGSEWSTTTQRLSRAHAPYSNDSFLSGSDKSPQSYSLENPSRFRPQTVVLTKPQVVSNGSLQFSKPYDVFGQTVAQTSISDFVPGTVETRSQFAANDRMMKLAAYPCPKGIGTNCTYAVGKQGAGPYNGGCTVTGLDCNAAAQYGASYGMPPTIMAATALQPDMRNLPPMSAYDALQVQQRMGIDATSAQLARPQPSALMQSMSSTERAMLLAQGTTVPAVHPTFARSANAGAVSVAHLA